HARPVGLEVGPGEGVAPLPEQITGDQWYDVGVAPVVEGANGKAVLAMKPAEEEGDEGDGDEPARDEHVGTAQTISQWRRRGKCRLCRDGADLGLPARGAFRVLRQPPAPVRPPDTARRSEQPAAAAAQAPSRRWGAGGIGAAL